MRTKGLGCWRQAIVFCALCVPLSGWCQPSVISPSAIALEHQLHSISSDFSDSPYFDLEQPQEFRVRIFEIHTPAQGYASVVFSIVAQSDDIPDQGYDPEQRYIGTLQTTAVVEKKQVKKQKFKSGAEATLWGWPASDRNQSVSTFLVDEIEFVGEGEHYYFHEPSGKMKKHQNSKGPKAGSEQG